MGRLTSLGLGLLGCGASEIFPLNSFPINLKEDIEEDTCRVEHNSDTPGNAVLPIGFGCAVGVLVRVVNVNPGQA